MLIQILVSILFSFGAEAQQTVTVYGDKDYRPYAFEENGEARGIYVDILETTFARMAD